MLDQSLSEAHSAQKSVPYYVGTVVDVADPTGTNRVRVTIPGKLENADLNGLPWIAPDRSSPFGQGKGFGVYGSPPIGSQVRVEFQGDDVNYGFYVSGLYAFDAANAEFVDPAVWGFVDPRGTKMVVNNTDGSFVFSHHSGFTIRSDSGGNFVIEGTSGTLSTSGQLTLIGSPVHINP